MLTQQLLNEFIEFRIARNLVSIDRLITVKMWGDYNGFKGMTDEQAEWLRDESNKRLTVV